MKKTKSIIHMLVVLLIIALLLMPLILIIQISKEEILNYSTPDVPVLHEVSVGKIAQSYRADVKEYITLSGVFTSAAYEYMNLEDFETANDIRWTVNIGDEIQQGQSIGHCEGENITSTVTGKITAIVTDVSNPYLQVQLFSPIELCCEVDDSTLSILKRSDSLVTVNNETVTITFLSNQKSTSGYTNIRVLIDTESYTFGEAVSNLKIYTGRTYHKTLVLPISCIYQKTTGKDAPWYVRQVTEDGILIREKPIDIGFSDGNVVCVTGIEEGTYYDTGYGILVGN